MLAGLLSLVMLVMALFPETAAARWLHRYLVELPLAGAASVRRADILLVLILIVGGQALVMVGSIDLAFLYAADLSLYLDAAIAVSSAAAVASLRTRWSSARAVLPVLSPRRVRPSARPRSRRSRVRPEPVARNDDEPAAPRRLAGQGAART